MYNNIYVSTYFYEKHGQNKIHHPPGDNTINTMTIRVNENKLLCVPQEATTLIRLYIRSFFNKDDWEQNPLSLITRCIVMGESLLNTFAF